MALSHVQNVGESTLNLGYNLPRYVCVILNLIEIYMSTLLWTGCGFLGGAGRGLC